MKKLLFLAFSIVLSLVLAYLAYFAKIESLTFVTSVTIIVLAILNVLANFFQVVSFIESRFVPKTTESISYKLGSEILTPLYVDMKKIKTHLEGFNLRQIDLELWRKKKEEYLFLTMKKELGESINNFYGNVEGYITLLERFKALVRRKISSGIYSYCEGIIVPSVNWETGDGFNSKFSSFCEEIAQKICDEVVTIALKRKSVSSLQPRELGVLESLFLIYLEKTIVLLFLLEVTTPK